MRLRQRVLVLGIVVVSCIGGAILSGPVFSPSLAVSGSPENHEFEPARPGENTYLLTDFAVVYPFVDPITGEKDETEAGVRYTPLWSGDEYPGAVACEVILRDQSGAVVGKHLFGLDSASPVTESVGFEPMSVDAGPDTASGSCEMGDAPDGPGYRFEGPLSIGAGDEGWALIEFYVTWAAEDPGTRSCTAFVTTRDGETIEVDHFTINVPNGGDFVVGAKMDSLSIVDADVQCSEPD